MIKAETHNIKDEIAAIKLSQSELISMYTDMNMLNMMESHLEQEYSKSHIRGFCHLIKGQEGLYAVLKKIIDNDLLISSYRCHGAAYAAGLSVKEIICENIGTAEGSSRGKGGSMHLYNDKFFGGHGIVGAQVPLGAGLAFAIKYKNYQKIKKAPISNNGRTEFISSVSPSVVFAIYGDGASNQGQVYETFNMAKVYNLPIVFIVENNKYGMYTPVEDVSVDDCFFKRGYGIPGIRTSDSEIENVLSVLNYAKKYACSNGPIIVQVDTNRTCGHSTLDTDQSYRSVSNLVEQSCLNNLENRLGQSVTEKVKNANQIEFDSIVSSINYSYMLDEKDLFTDLFV